MLLQHNNLQLTLLQPGKLLTLKTNIMDPDHLKMEMEMEIPSSSNVKLITEFSDTTYCGLKVSAIMTSVAARQSTTGGSVERNSTSTKTVNPQIVMQSDPICEFLV
ncbi:hypothetical protein Tco_0015663 [Tanacetum coccineum]